VEVGWCVSCEVRISSLKSPWLLVRKRTIPTERSQLVSEF
jgi:hypothetical protein